VAVPPAILIRVSHLGWFDGSRAMPGPWPAWSVVAKQQIIRSQPACRDVGHDLGGDLGAELEPPVLLVLGVVLDQEPATGRAFLAGDLHDSAADGKDPRDRIQITGPQLGQLTPPQAAFNVGLHQQPGIRVRQRCIQQVELRDGDNPSRLLQDWRGLHPPARMDRDNLIPPGRW